MLANAEESDDHAASALLSNSVRNVTCSALTPKTRTPKTRMLRPDPQNPQKPVKTRPRKSPNSGFTSR